MRNNGTKVRQMSHITREAPRETKSHIMRETPGRQTSRMTREAAEDARWEPAEAGGAARLGLLTNRRRQRMPAAVYPRRFREKLAGMWDMRKPPSHKQPSL
ncbi:hypothetical protein DQG13_26400 [Paenibacillus sp. YN15]|nr:hypothetical protein DQG13_26400 [Paenibacillus sp. YN15]